MKDVNKAQPAEDATVESTTTVESRSTRAAGQTVPLAQLLRDSQRAVSRSLAASIVKYGVSIGQWYFLRVLWEGDGITQRELSGRVGMMEPTTVTALNGMERRGLVERVRNPDDRRKINVFLTSLGWELRDKLLPIEERVNAEALERIGQAEQQALETGLRKVLDNLTEDA